ncbi:MAG: aromatic ring-hydroxylating dioxygenase subunit alpha [Flavobacteriales bacterium]|nr:aromatic ring-hydroxylating dioxygenase subunit alpha [Flavobacteriales bacterium]MCX7649676.1 aromatic ring-hydroxylating dioxygenase subunit alpha [Flavobacteriales bacterium]MDW8432143.1 aromatic ring-hydroxylating dioxygenase subunit alpha [Flavobacteriales bacterium]
MLYQVAQDIREARTLPATYYRDPKALDTLREHVFPVVWHYVGSEDQCPEPGWLHPVTLLPGFLDEPLLLSRDTEGRLNLLSNVCTHRGNILISENCKRKEIVCAYHGRRFSLDGRMLSMPFFQEAKNFPGASDNLTSLPLRSLGPLLFSQLQEGLTFEKVFYPLFQKLFWMDFKALKPRPDLSRIYQVRAHWALYVENYLEGFHIPFVHKGLNSALDFKEYSIEIFPGSVLQTAPASQPEEGFEAPQALCGQRPAAAFYFWFWPNLMLNFYPWGLSVNVVVPQSLDKTLVFYATFVCDEKKMGRGAGAELHRVEMEDQAVVEQVQRGLRTRLYTSGRYSPQLEAGTHYFHRLLAHFHNDPCNFSILDYDHSSNVS